MATEDTTLKGFVIAMLLHDVCEEIRLEELRAMLGARRAAPSFKHATPEHVRFAKPPVIETAAPTCLNSGEELRTEVKYYDYGVISVVFELPFEADWQSLAAMAARFVPSPELERKAQDIVRERLQRIECVCERLHREWIAEDYYVFELSEVDGHPVGADLLSQHGDEIARILRGENTDLARSERADALQSSLSYYPNDLIVVGWNAALIYDTPAGAEAAIQILEYANSQLLEFRHYDDLLTSELDAVYASFKRRAGLLARWRMRGEASRLNSVTVEVAELVERADTAIKFVSDMFAARLYRLAATKVGVPEYKNIVNEKLKTAENLYRFLIDEFHQSRGFALEVMVIIILVIELIFLFKGKG
jgi:hypothetical protein